MNEIEKNVETTSPEDLVFSIVPIQEETLQLRDFKKVPLAELATFGTELAELIPNLRTVKSTVKLDGRGLYRAVIPEGAHLANAKGGGHLGSIVVDGKGLQGQAIFHDAGDLTALVETKIPVDPATLALAVAMAEINIKLDQIQETQKKLFDYIKNENIAELQSCFTTMNSIMREFRFNWNDSAYRSSVLTKLLDIRQEADMQINHCKLQIDSAVNDEKLLSLDFDAKRSLEETRQEFDRYRAALYLYSTATLLTASLQQNKSAGYLEQTANEIENRRLEYRKNYSTCYNRLERQSHSAVEGKVLYGVSKATSVLAKAVAKTPLGEHTQLDEGLEHAGKGIGQFNRRRTEALMEKLLPVQDCDVSPMAEQVRTINLLLNKPVELLSDGDALYYHQLEAPKEIGIEP